MIRSEDKNTICPITAEFQHTHPITNSAINHNRLQFFGHFADVDNIGKEQILFPMCLQEDLGKNLFGLSHASGT